MRPLLRPQEAETGFMSTKLPVVAQTYRGNKFEICMLKETSKYCIDQFSLGVR